MKTSLVIALAAAVAATVLLFGATASLTSGAAVAQTAVPFTAQCWGEKACPPAPNRPRGR